MVNKAESEGFLKGIKLAPSAPRVNHVLFAYDSLMLLEANVQNVETVKSILQTYEECSSQGIDRDKSSVMFISNTKRNMKIFVATSVRAWVRSH